MTQTRQFIYVLKLVPSLLIEENWTSHEEKLVDDHFKRLQYLLNAGKLILAGKTDGMDEDTFGIVILEVETREEAEQIMLSDPAVVGGVMTAELFPYRVALSREKMQR